MTGGLTTALINSIKEEFETRNPELVEAFNFVCSAMIGHRGNAGVDPYSALNVERVFSAIRLLQNRSDHEAAPFVSTWLPSVEAFDSHPVPSSDANLVQEMNRALSSVAGGHGLTKTIAKIARIAMQPGNGDIYRELDAALKTQVCKLLARHKDVSYLEPLADLALKQGGLTVATLNYDLTVESMCQAAGVDVDTGILNWTPGKALTFSQGPGSLNLIKLHGSINWTSTPKIPGMDDSSRFIRTQTLTEIEATNNRHPAIVIGDREKLTADGPTLALMHSFEEGLTKADRLIIIGYSFGDAHINSVIRNWINARATRTLTVLDPFWSWDATGFQKDLINGLTDSPSKGRQANRE
ncbi:SIR2 family protein [Arthrobacter sp. MMS24-S77]